MHTHVCCWPMLQGCVACVCVTQVQALQRCIAAVRSCAQWGVVYYMFCLFVLWRWCGSACLSSSQLLHMLASVQGCVRMTHSQRRRTDLYCSIQPATAVRAILRSAVPALSMAALFLQQECASPATRHYVVRCVLGCCVLSSYGHLDIALPGFRITSQADVHMHMHTQPAWWC